MCCSGAKKRYGELTDAITARLEHELETIEKMGFTDYFLIVQDFIAFAKSQGIPVGPGRGSGAGSLCAYCSGITDIDPIKYDLLFERFLNPERVSMPDFDIDFGHLRRQEVIRYVIGKYGSDHVAQIVTFGTLAAHAAIRDTGRVLGLSYSKIDSVAALISNELNITLERALERSEKLRAPPVAPRGGGRHNQRACFRLRPARTQRRLCCDPVHDDRPRAPGTAENGLSGAQKPDGH